METSHIRGQVDFGMEPPLVPFHVPVFSDRTGGIGMHLDMTRINHQSFKIGLFDWQLKQFSHTPLLRRRQNRRCIFFQLL
jgi:hypothetical protein